MDVYVDLFDRISTGVTYEKYLNMNLHEKFSIIKKIICMNPALTSRFEYSSADKLERERRREKTDFKKYVSNKLLVVES